MLVVSRSEWITPKDEVSLAVRHAISAAVGGVHWVTTRRIAVVDDDPSVRRVIARSIRSLSHEAVEYTSAEEFLAVGPRGFDCLFVDLHMPGMGGIELLARLAELGISVPAVVVTARPLPSTLEHARAHGAAALLRKPFDLASLEATIRNVADG